MAYDRDGSIGVRLDSGVITQMTADEMRFLNDESSASGQGDNTTRQYGILFPDLRDVVGFFVATASGGDEPARAFQTSPDTTTGLDGTWTTVIGGAPPQVYGPSISPNYRTLVQVVDWPGIRAVRYTAGRVQWAFHLYGSLSPGQGLDRLRIWDPILNQEAGGAVFDFGNTPRHSSADKQFRVKNISPSRRANGVTVFVEVLTDATPGLVPQLLLSSDGVRFSQVLSLGSLNAGEITSRFYLRRVTPANAQLGPMAFRVVATASSYS
jgi:hypothetical protein